MISIIITSFNEPKTITRAIISFVRQNIQEDYELLVAAPDKETLDIARGLAAKYRQIRVFQDPGKGKSHAINLLLQKVKGRIILLSDGDVFVSQNSVNEILRHFQDERVGCVSGQPVSANSRDNLFGYWSNLLCYSAHRLRQKRQSASQFLECSGYLWAFRNFVIKKFPKDIGEDTIVPIMFWLKGYKIEYEEAAKVYVKYPDNLSDFLKQKRRAAGAHDNIGKYVNLRQIPRMKTFFNEISGSLIVLSFPRTFKELVYTLTLFPIRLYIWLNLFYNSKIKRRKYTDAWKRVESTK